MALGPPLILMASFTSGTQYNVLKMNYVTQFLNSSSLCYSVVIPSRLADMNWDLIGFRERIERECPTFELFCCSFVFNCFVEAVYRIKATVVLSGGKPPEILAGAGIAKRETALRTTG